MQRYKVEPYVVAADVYSVPPHVGRGGWTWYTGSAGWMYRAGLESILGLRVQRGVAADRSVHPERWPGFEMRCATAARYEISVRNPGKVSRGVVAAELDGASQAVSKGKVRLKLSEDRGTHAIVVILGLVTLG